LQIVGELKEMVLVVEKEYIGATQASAARVRGFSNPGTNTCYMASVLQVLLRCGPMQRTVPMSQHLAWCTEECLICAVEKCWVALHRKQDPDQPIPAAESVCLLADIRRHLTPHLSHANFGDYGDILYFLGNLGEHFMRVRSAQDRHVYVDSLFEIKMMQYVSCTGCGKDTTEEFTVPMPLNLRFQPRGFSASFVEALENLNPSASRFCAHCQEPCKGSTPTLLAAPQVLVLYVSVLWPEGSVLGVGLTIMLFGYIIRQ
jgi:uncharacterized UBP type Zn finger protein